MHGWKHRYGPDFGNNSFEINTTQFWRMRKNSAVDFFPREPEWIPFARPTGALGGPHRLQQLPRTRGTLRPRPPSPGWIINIPRPIQIATNPKTLGPDAAT